MGKLKIYLFLILIVPQARAQVQKQSDFEYLKRIFVQEEHWRDLHFEQELYRYLNAFPTGVRSDTVRYFLGYYYARSGHPMRAAYFLQSARYLTTDSLLIMHILLLEKQLHLVSPSKSFPNFSRLGSKISLSRAERFFRWLIGIRPYLNDKNKACFYDDCRRFLNRFPNHPQVMQIEKMSTHLFQLQDND